MAAVFWVELGSLTGHPLQTKRKPSLKREEKTRIKTIQGWAELIRQLSDLCLKVA